MDDLNYALQNRIEWIALSFVRSEADIKDLKKKIRNKRRTAKVIAKIEKPQAIENIEEIIKEADGIMVARGDLGVEIPFENLPLIQKQIVSKSRKHSKPVIIATQMMESMIHNTSPTRAEVNDVANAVMDGADAVMLSGETSVGNNPVEVIKTMYKIVENAETFEDLYYKVNVLNLKQNRDISDAICQNAIKLARDSGAKAIVTMSFSGYTGFKISSYRPKANTFVFTANKPILNMLSLLWGVRGFYYNKFVSTDDTINDIMEILETEGFVKKGDLIINIASMPIRGKGKSNMLKLSKVE
jgi:pyruvate kinase